MLITQSDVRMNKRSDIFLNSKGDDFCLCLQSESSLFSSTFFYCSKLLKKIQSYFSTFLLSSNLLIQM